MNRMLYGMGLVGSRQYSLYSILQSDSCSQSDSKSVYLARPTWPGLSSSERKKGFNSVLQESKRPGRQTQTRDPNYPCANPVFSTAIHKGEHHSIFLAYTRSQCVHWPHSDVVSLCTVHYCVRSLLANRAQN
eukprot:3181290-Pyramimonas_sp.AAC.2